MEMHVSSHIVDGAAPPSVHRTLSVRSIYASALLAYLFSILFFYQYGITLGSEFAVRVPDVFAYVCVSLAAALLAYNLRFSAHPRVLWPILPVMTLEVLLPIIGTVAAGGGMAGLSNGLRMLFLWAPLVCYFLVVLDGPCGDGFHKRIRKILIFALLTNLIYGVMQILAKVGFLPGSTLILVHLAPLAIDDTFQPVIQGFRAQGFFVNSTGLSVFGICGVAYFLGSHFDGRKRGDLVYALLSALLVILSLSRTGLAALVAILVTYLFFANVRRAFFFLLQFGALAALALVVIDRYLGLEFLQSRLQIFMALGAAGALEDFSFTARLYGTWPETLAELQQYPFGTLVSASAELGLIDSGYLTYYAQGKWPFLAAFALLLVALIGGGIRSWLSGRNGAQLAAFFLGIYLTVAMIVSNPMRSALLVFMLTYLLWQVFERRSHQRVPSQETLSRAEQPCAPGASGAASVDVAEDRPIQDTGNNARIKQRIVPDVSLLIGSLRGGGGERVCVTLANELAQRGWQVEVVVLNLREEKYGWQLDERVRLVNLGVSQIRTGLHALWRYLYSTKPKVVLTFAHQLAIAIIFLRTVSSPSTRLVARTGSILSKKQEHAKDRWNQHVAPFLTRALYRKSDVVVAQSRGMAHDLITHFRIPEGKVVTIENPLPAWLRSNRESKKPVTSAKSAGRHVLFVGRLDPVKDPVLLLNAFALCLRSRDDIILDIVGTGSMEASLRTLAMGAEFQGKVRMHGFVSNVRDFYARADVTVLCSHFEGLPNCLLESIACGTPVVSIDCDYGPAEIVRDGVNGLLVRSRSEHDFSVAILKALGMQWNAAEMTATLTRFETPAVVDRYERLIRSLQA